MRIGTGQRNLITIAWVKKNKKVRFILDSRAGFRYYIDVVGRWTPDLIERGEK